MVESAYSHPVPAATGYIFFFMEGPMLILSRRVDEGVVFDGPGRVIVVEIRNDKVRLGFVADKSVAIHRDEVAERIRSEGKETV